MAIELTQIHNVVRTYHQAIRFSLSGLHEVERTGEAKHGLTPASPGTRERNIMRVIHEVLIIHH
jgi:hypothetical protein